jgi:hypothetical protein
MMRISVPGTGGTGVDGEAARQTFCAEIQDFCFEGQFRKERQLITSPITANSGLSYTFDLNAITPIGFGTIQRRIGGTKDAL